MTRVLPTAFHARTSERNRANAWVQRGLFTLPAHYGDVTQETLAARVSAVLVDISSREELHVEGAGAAALLSAACGQDLTELGIGSSSPVLWCADGGGLRGIGVVSRLGETAYQLRSHDADLGWFAPAARRFGATLRETTRERGLLLLMGPYAFAVLAAAGFEEAAYLEVGQHSILSSHGLSIAVLRGSHGRFQVSCAADDALKTFDRLNLAGYLFGLRLAGQQALEILELEAGLPLPGIDFVAAREAFARLPSPAALGLLEGDGEHAFVGLELDSDHPAPFTPIFHQQAQAGRTMRSAYSPALRRAIALATVSPSLATPGKELTIRRQGGTQEIQARVVALPFLA